MERGLRKSAHMAETTEEMLEVVELLEKAQSLAPHEPLVKLHLGLAYAAFGKRDHARIALREAARSPGFARRQEALDALTKL